MYLIPITTPVYVEGDKTFVQTPWKRSLELLRDSLGGRYGPLVSAAPMAPAETSDQPLSPAGPGEEIELLPLFERSMSAREYWKSGTHKATQAQLAPYMGADSVVHATVSDPLRPFSNTALQTAVKAGLPTVFVLDQDDATSMQDLVKDQGFKKRMKVRLIAKLFERQARRAASTAGLCFFKGAPTVARYGAIAQDLLQIENTSFLTEELPDEAPIRARLADLQKANRPLEFAFAGRLVALKGLDRSLALIAAARAEGANVRLSIIGGGPEEAALKALAGELGLADHVSFLGPMEYGPPLLNKLAEFDALLFNPRISETPRMLFDAYAAGLPIVADAITYVQEREAGEGATVSFPWNDDAAAVAAIVGLDRDRGRMSELTQNALAARVTHAADNWYKRRADATHAMVERIRAQKTHA